MTLLARGLSIVLAALVLVTGGSGLALAQRTTVRHVSLTIDW